MRGRRFWVVVFSASLGVSLGLAPSRGEEGKGAGTPAEIGRASCRERV
jgi:hypothetical protein